MYAWWSLHQIMASKDVHTETSEEFSGLINKALSSGFLCVGLAVGSATGLFEAMARLGEPKTSNEIAREAHKKERYVREWLAAMVTGNIVNYDPDEETYFLPPSRLQVLVPGKSANNVCNMLKMLPAICEGYSDVLECMEPDGPRGVPETSFTSFHRVVNDIASARFANGLPYFLRNMDDIIAQLESGIMVCDMGCGKGTAVLEMAKAFPKSTFCGFDISQAAVLEAQKTAEGLSLVNLSYHCYDASKTPADWANKFNLEFSFDALHDQARPDLALKECFRILKDGGYLIIVEVDSHSKLKDNLDNPAALEMYTCSLMHCMPVSLYHEGGLGYGTMWGMEELISLVENAKLTCERHYKAKGISDRVFVCRKIQK